MSVSVIKDETKQGWGGGANWCLLSRDARRGKSMKLRFARLLPQQGLMPCNATHIVKLNITNSEL